MTQPNTPESEAPASRTPSRHSTPSLFNHPPGSQAASSNQGAQSSPKRVNTSSVSSPNMDCIDLSDERSQYQDACAVARLLSAIMRHHATKEYLRYTESLTELKQLVARYQAHSDILANLLLNHLRLFQGIQIANPEQATGGNAAHLLIEALSSVEALAVRDQEMSFVLGVMVELFENADFQNTEDVNFLVSLIRVLPDRVITEIDHVSGGDTTLLTYAQEHESQACIEAIQARLLRLNAGSNQDPASSAAVAAHASRQSPRQALGVFQDQTSSTPSPDDSEFKKRQSSTPN